MSCAAQHRILRIQPGELTFIRIDHQCRLQFENTEIMIETPFSLQVEDREYQLDPEDRANFGPLLAVYPNSLLSANVDSEATLRLEFESGARVIVRQDPDYEAWQVSGPDTYLVVCVPGTEGNLAVWS